MIFNVLLHLKKNVHVTRTRTVTPWFSLFAIFIVIAPLVISTAAGAAVMAYTGALADLNNVPNWVSTNTPSSLFPNISGTPLSSDNQVIIDYVAGGAGMTNPNFVFGGLSQFEKSANNNVEIVNGIVDGFVHGAYSQNSVAADNVVTINGANVGRDVYGGYSQYNSATGNTLTIRDGIVSGAAYGAYGSGIAKNNSITISGGMVSNTAWGGYSSEGISENNTVTISGGYVAWDIYGGYSAVSDAENNIVTISGGSVGDDVCGGFSFSRNATGNTVAISSGKVGVNVHGGYSRDGDVKSNDVTISSGNVNGYVDGGHGLSGDVAYNTVTVSGGKVGGDVYGGYCSNGGVAYNTITISGGEVAGDIIGGINIGGSAKNNTVAISGGEVARDIVGGYSANLDAIHNVVTISGSPILTTSEIYGGYTGGGTADAFTGNTLNFKSSGISAVGVSNFQYYNFYLPENTVANETMLSVTNAVDLSGTTVEIFLQGSSSSLQAGDKVALINSAGGVSVSPNNTSSTASLGAFMTYGFSIYSDANNLWAQLAAINDLLPSNVILTDSRLAPLAFLSQGADLVASLEYLEVSGDKRFNTFAIAGGGSSTYDTGAGAEVDVDGFSMLAGVMWNAPVNKNSLIVSAFFEAGWGSYDTYRDFGADGVVRGSGDSDYYGGGLHMRYKWDSGRPGGLYAEGSLRFGRNKSDFHTNDLSTVSDFSYDSSSNYFGAHVGLGYVWQLSGKTRLEAMSKYLWTRLGSDEVTASSGDRISFDSLNSSRWRTGFRMYHDYGNANAVTLYYGAMYEYEFGGDAEGRLGGLGLDGISLSGGSGIGELGVIFRPSKDNDRLTMQLGVQGYVGAREGVSGTLKLQYAF